MSRIEKVDTNPNIDTIEFNYLLGFYLKISYSKSALIISAYNLDLIDGKRYENQFTLATLYKLSDVFQDLQKMKNIYNYIVKSIKEKNLELLKTQIIYY